MKEYYVVARGFTGLIEADSLKQARERAAKKFDLVHLVKRATQGDVDFIKWLARTTDGPDNKTKPKEPTWDDGAEPGDTGEREVAHRGPRC